MKCCILHCRFSDVNLQSVDNGRLSRQRSGMSSSAANLRDGLYENQLIPNFQRVTICGEDASEVCYSLLRLSTSIQGPINKQVLSLSISDEIKPLF